MLRHTEPDDLEELTWPDRVLMERTGSRNIEEAVAVRTAQAVAADSTARIHRRAARGI